jgi:peptidoglycan-associated lipoprotein
MADAPSRFVPVLGLALAAACGGKQVEETPPPAPQMVSHPAPPPAPAPTPMPEPEPAPDTRSATLEQRIHFALDRADLSSEARATLAAKVEILRMSPGLTLRIDGHADERGSDEYNLALSKRRAAEAKRFLMGQGIEASRLDAVGYGEERPINPSATEAAWAMNRRADFQVTGGALSQR